MDPLAIIYRDLCRHASLTESLSAPVVPNLSRLLDGSWSAEDLIEYSVDETSTSSAVGLGTDRPLRPMEDEEDPEEIEEVAHKIIVSLAAHPNDDADLRAHRFLETHRPQSTRAFRQAVIKAIRREGY